MDRDRSAALGGFVRVLCTDPTGDGAARAMVMGALAPLGGIAGQIYGIGRPDTLELLGNFGWRAPDAAQFRALDTGMPLPACEAFTTMSTVALPWRDLHEAFPLTAAGHQAGSLDEVPGASACLVACVPIVWSESAVGVLVALVEERPSAASGDWPYLDAVAGALALWMLEQRRTLMDNWRRAAPLPHGEITISPRQHRVLEMVGDGRTDAEIAAALDLSLAMIRQDLGEVMDLMGTEDRRSAAGRARELGLLPDRRTRGGAR